MCRHVCCHLAEIAVLVDLEMLKVSDSAVHDCSVKTTTWKISQNLQGNICAEICF